MDVKFTQSTDGRQHLVDAGTVNDNVERPASRRPVQRQWPLAPTARSPSRSTIAARRARTTRASCPPMWARRIFCIDVSLQAYKDSGSGAVLVGGNVPITKFSWTRSSRASR